MRFLTRVRSAVIGGWTTGSLVAAALLAGCSSGTIDPAGGGPIDGSDSGVDSNVGDVVGLHDTTTTKDTAGSGDTTTSTDSSTTDSFVPPADSPSPADTGSDGSTCACAPGKPKTLACGVDSCGNSCGTCGAGTTCGAFGTCVSPGTCGAVSCGGATPDCDASTKTCVCNSTSCGAGLTCSGGTCVSSGCTSGCVTMKWYGGCWFHGTIYGYTGNYQSVDFDLSTSSPVEINGTLFASKDCDVSASAFGGDNMNDFGTKTGSTHGIQGFTHHPDLIPSSAIFWVGPRTADGFCPPGAPCSGCFNYDATTPSCDALP